MNTQTYSGRVVPLPVTLKGHTLLYLCKDIATSISRCDQKKETQSNQISHASSLQNILKDYLLGIVVLDIPLPPFQSLHSHLQAFLDTVIVKDLFPVLILINSEWHIHDYSSLTEFTRGEDTYDLIFSVYYPPPDILLVTQLL
jgi:hypothetical protein